MNKNILKTIILDNIEFISQIEFIERFYPLEPNGNYAVTGIRRCGKSYLLLNELKKIVKLKKPYVYINFEDERFIEFTARDFNLIVESSRELFTEKPVFCFDEIQTISGWEKFVRWLADSGYRLLITGSNAKMLSKEVASVLGGRFLAKELLPLSFREFLSFHEVVLNNNYEFTEQRFKIKELFNQFFNFGGFPELVKFVNPREYLSNIFMKVFYGDIIVRNNIKNEQILKLLIKKLAESVNNETSVNRIKNLIKSTGIKVGSNTIFDYLSYLYDAYLIYGIENYIAPFSERESKKKYYFVDQGILKLFLNDQDTKLLENIVFIALHRHYPGQVYYFKRKLEVDFLLPDSQLLIQVSYSISNYETRQRECKALALAMQELGLRQARILTFDEEEDIEYQEYEIKVMPVWKWLLKDL